MDQRNLHARRPSGDHTGRFTIDDEGELALVLRAVDCGVGRGIDNQIRRKTIKSPWKRAGLGQVEDRTVGRDDIAELQDDAVIAALHDQFAAGLDVVTDGEQTRLDFNLSFYGFLEGLELEGASPRRFGPPAHDQRGKHAVKSDLKAPRGLGAVEEFQRRRRADDHRDGCGARMTAVKKLRTYCAPDTTETIMDSFSMISPARS